MVGEFPIQPEQSLGFQPSLPEDFCATSATVFAGISFGCVVPFPFLHISTLEAHPTHRKWFIDVKSWRGLKLRNHQHRAGKHRCREPEVSRWATGPRACVITHLTVDTLRGDVVVSECFRYVMMIFVTLCCWVFSIPLDCFLWGWNMFFHQAAMSPCLANYSHGYIIYLWLFAVLTSA